MERRIFLKNTLTGAAALGASSFIPGGLTEVFGQKAPSNKVKVGLIGCNGMGWSNLNRYLDNPEVEAELRKAGAAASLGQGAGS